MYHYDNMFVSDKIIWVEPKFMWNSLKEFYSYGVMISHFSNKNFWLLLLRLHKISIKTIKSLYFYAQKIEKNKKDCVFFCMCQTRPNICLVTDGSYCSYRRLDSNSHYRWLTNAMDRCAAPNSAGEAASKPNEGRLPSTSAR